MTLADVEAIVAAGYRCEVREANDCAYRPAKNFTRDGHYACDACYALQPPPTAAEIEADKAFMNKFENPPRFYNFPDPPPLILSQEELAEYRKANP